jgi:hypothetical protein
MPPASSQSAPATAAPAAAHQGHQPAPMPGHEMHVTTPPLDTTSPPAPRTSAEIAGIAPAATLAPDPLDAPVPISVAEAEKAARASEEGHAGHEADAPATPPAPAPSDHSGHVPPPPNED